MATLFGITGGIGSGKSVICARLEELGYKVFYTDQEAQHIMCENLAVRSQIEMIFGSEIYQNDILDRGEVARQIFAQPDLRERVNKAVHPAVRFTLEHWLKRQTDICFVESAILFESRLSDICIANICISAPMEMRVMRTINRDACTREQVLDRINSQMLDNEMQNMSDLVVNNDGKNEISALCLYILDFCRNFAK